MKKSSSQLDFKLLRRLIEFSIPYKKEIFIAIIFVLLLTITGPIRPYIIQQGIDKFISNNDFEGLLFISIYLFILFAVNSFARYYMTYKLDVTGLKILNDLRQKVYNHIINLSAQFYDKNPTGKLVTRVTNDIESLSQLFSNSLISIIADLLLIVSILVFMFAMNVELTLIILSILPFMVVITLVFKKKIRDVFNEIRTQLSLLNTFFSEHLNGIITVKIFNRVDYQKEKFSKINLRYFQENEKSIKYYSFFFPAIELIATISLGLLLWYSGMNLLSGVMTVGTLIAFLQYSEMFFRPIRDLSEKFTTLQSSLASSERIFEILDTENEIIHGQNNITHFEELIFDKVSFSYDNQKIVLNDLSFSLKKGQKIAFVGATGSGKTTISGLLTKFYNGYIGKITINGLELNEIANSSIYNLMAIVQQDVTLFTGTIKENITLFDENNIDDDKFDKILNELGLNSIKSKLVELRDVNLNERGINLSFGERQLVSICRAYYKNPEFIILDEATSNIDSETEELINNALNKLMQGKTSLYIAHRLSTIVDCDMIYVLSHGQIIEKGTHNELIKQNGHYKKLYEIQQMGIEE